MAKRSSTKKLFVVLGNQLFPFAHVKPHRDARFFMAEDVGLCTYVRHHKQKIVLFLAAMRAYRDELVKNDCRVHYETLEDGKTYEERLTSVVKQRKFDELIMWEIEDKFFEQRMKAFADEHNLSLTFLPSPMFLTPRADFANWLDKKRPFMASFYQWQRKRLGLLLENDGGPVGGRWSYDDENRKALPKDVAIPQTGPANATDHVTELISIVNERFAEHPGELSEATWWLPTTRRQALDWLRQFIEQRFDTFGPYEDALSTRDPFLFHSVLTPVLNLGLVTPDEVVERAMMHAADHDIPLNSLEGFVRQIIGWREFIRGVYQRFSEKQEAGNFFGHKRKLTAMWYDGTTGLLPLDDVIHKTQRYGWAHHIERLMVAANLMTLCEIHPRDAYRWFMEMFVDSSDWVMVPNVLGMGIFADGGIFSTKPYICGSNYIRKMSDYPKPRPDDHIEGCRGTWCDVTDGLYWRFVDKNREFFKGQARMAQLVGTLDRMKADRRNAIFESAELFIKRVTT